MKHLMTAAALCIGMFGAQAQTTPTKATPAAKPAVAMAHPMHNCMMASDKDWASLKLSAEQTEKVKGIQAECMKECGAMMKTDPKMAKMMDKHEANVKAVLTPEQYENWMKWCSAQASAAPMKK